MRRFVWSFDFSTKGRMSRLPRTEHAPHNSTICDVISISSSDGFRPPIPISFASRNRLAWWPHLGPGSPCPPLMKTT